MDDIKKLKLTDKNGNEQEYEILLAFKLPKTEKNYVVYTDNTKDESGSLNIYASIYYPDDDTRLDSIETEEEWNAIECMLKTLK